jgi:hypothetical protein
MARVLPGSGARLWTQARREITSFLRVGMPGDGRRICLAAFR